MRRLEDPAFRVFGIGMKIFGGGIWNRSARQNELLWRRPRGEDMLPQDVMQGVAYLFCPPGAIGEDGGQ